MQGRTQYLSWIQVCILFDAVMSTGEVPNLSPVSSDWDGVMPTDPNSYGFSVGYPNKMIEGPGNHGLQTTPKIGIRSNLREKKNERPPDWASFRDGNRRVIEVGVTHSWDSSSFSTFDAIAQAALINQQAQRASLFMSVIERFVIVAESPTPTADA